LEILREIVFGELSGLSLPKPLRKIPKSAWLLLVHRVVPRKAISHSSLDKSGANKAAGPRVGHHLPWNHLGSISKSIIFPQKAEI
jgi:hypothetical protein